MNTKLEEIDRTKNPRKKLALLKVYAHSKEDLPALKLYLEGEMRRSHNKEWMHTCRKWHVWVENNLNIHLGSFDPVQFLIQMESNRPLKEKVYLINQFLKEIKREHKEILAWFEARLESNHAALRKVAKQVLEALAKLGTWKSKAPLFLQSGKSASFKEFRKASRDEKLNWLQEAGGSSEIMDCLFEWGITALCMEMDPFVISALIKRVPTILLEERAPLSRFLLILESFLWDEDPRMRANALEGLGALVSHPKEGDRIAEVLTNFLEDPDVRVRTTAMLAIHTVDPAQTSDRVEDLLQISRSAEDFDSIQWLLSEASKSRKDLQPFAQMARERLAEWKSLHPDDDLSVKPLGPS